MNPAQRDLIYEAQDARPLIEWWLLRFALAFAVTMVVVSLVSLYAAIKVSDPDISVYAIEPKGDAFPLPFYSTVEDAVRAINHQQ